MIYSLANLHIIIDFCISSFCQFVIQNSPQTNNIIASQAFAWLLRKWN